MPEVTLRLSQPAVLGRRPRETGAIDTHRHVPGSVLRGALANVWIREHGPLHEVSEEKRAEFLYLFEGPVRYGPLFDTASGIVPLSVVTCKYRPYEKCHSFYHDRADPDAASTASDELRCRHCRGRTQSGRGDVEFFGADPGVSQHTRVALGEDERARENMLFTRRALRHRVGGATRQLTGRIIGGDPDRIGWLLTEHRLRIGGRRSTAGGARYLPTTSSGTPPDPAVLAHGGHLLLRCASPALLVDAAGRPTQRPDEQQLSELLGVPAHIETSWVRREQVTGWYTLTNLPKPTELAVSSGSVFRLRLDAVPSADGLARLTDHGLGLRRAEGFGWIELGPWHQPPAAHAATPVEKEDQGRGMARLLHEETKDGAWYLDKLRQCLLDRRLGDKLDLGFLKSSRAESLDLYRNGNLRHYITKILADESTEVLEAIVVHLEARVRKERGQ